MGTARARGNPFLALLVFLLFLTARSQATDARPKRPPPRRPPPQPPGAPGTLPQFYVHYGKCGHNLQQQEYGAWIMTRPLSKQVASRRSLILQLDTRNASPVAPAFGTVSPSDFPIRQLNLAYFNNSGVMAWSPALDATPYTEVRSYYTVRVNSSTPLASSVRDLKDVGVKTPNTFVYSLKARLNGIVAPSTSPYRIEVIKTCALSSAGAATAACAAVPDPAAVFLSPEGYFAYSFWGVGQSLTVNGVFVQDHAWCPVQTGVTVP